MNLVSYALSKKKNDDQRFPHSAPVIHGEGMEGHFKECKLLQICGLCNILDTIP